MNFLCLKNFLRPWEQIYILIATYFLVVMIKWKAHGFERKRKYEKAGKILYNR
jgi:hypothetical protein